MLFKNDLEGGPMGEGGGCFLGMQHADVVVCLFFIHGGKVGLYSQIGKRHGRNQCKFQNIKDVL